MVHTRQQQRAQEAREIKPSSVSQDGQPSSVASPLQPSQLQVISAIPEIVLQSIEEDPPSTGGQDSPMSNAAQYGGVDNTSNDDSDYEDLAVRATNAMHESPDNAAYARGDQSVEPFPDVESEADPEIRALRQASFESLQRRQNQNLHDEYSPRIPDSAAGMPDGRHAVPADYNRDVPAPVRRPSYNERRTFFEEDAIQSPVYEPASPYWRQVHADRALTPSDNDTQPNNATHQGQFNPELVYGYQPAQQPVQLPPIGEMLANGDPMHQHLLRQVEDAERRAHQARQEAFGEANEHIHAAEEYAHDNLEQRQALQTRMGELEQEHQNAQGLLHNYVANLRQRDVRLRQQQEELDQAQVREQQRVQELEQARVREEALQAQAQAAAVVERELRRDLRIGNIDNRTLQMTIDHAADVRGLRHAMANHDDQIRVLNDQNHGLERNMGRMNEAMSNVEERVERLETLQGEGRRGNFRGPGRQVGGGGGQGGGPQRRTSLGSPYARSL